eukprot:1499666-Rhodomonas_salina.2
MLLNTAWYCGTLWVITVAEVRFEPVPLLGFSYHARRQVADLTWASVHPAPVPSITSRPDPAPIRPDRASARPDPAPLLGVLSGGLAARGGPGSTPCTRCARSVPGLW